MLGSTVYNTLLDVVRKDKRGNSMSIDSFNNLSVLVNERLQEDYFSQFEADMDSSSDYGEFKVLAYPLTITAGKATLPSNYYRLIGEPYHVDSTHGTRYIDVVTTLEKSKRQRNSLTAATTKNPICEIGSEDSSGNIEIRVYPTSITTIYMDYLRKTATPFLDYYVNENTLQPTFLTAGQAPYTVASPYVYRDGTTGSKTSATVDWDFGNGDLPLIISYFLQLMGIQLPDEGLLNVGKIDKNEILA